MFFTSQVEIVASAFFLVFHIFCCFVAVAWFSADDCSYYRIQDSSQIINIIQVILSYTRTHFSLPMLKTSFSVQKVFLCNPGKCFGDNYGFVHSALSILSESFVNVCQRELDIKSTF